MNARTHNTKRWIAIGLAVGAIGAPVAQAANSSDGATAQLPTIDELQQFRFTPSTAVAVDGLPTIDELQQFRFTPDSAVPVEGLPTVDDLAQFRFTPSDAPTGATLTHPFSFTGPSNEPVGPTTVTPDPTRGLPTIDDLQQFRFIPESQTPPVTTIVADGIDWPDVGIGAGMAIGALLLGAAAGMGLRRHNRLAHS
jgi:hypothetical protein